MDNKTIAAAETITRANRPAIRYIYPSGGQPRREIITGPLEAPAENVIRIIAHVEEEHEQAH